MASYPLTRLKQLLRQDAPARGIVTRVDRTSIEVATRQGLVRAQAAGTLATGQAVMLRDGRAYPAARATRRYAL